MEVILNVDESRAYLQNADTNAYLEGKFEGKADLQNGKVPVSQLPEMGYTKEEILTTETAAKFGLGADAAPNDVFGFLGKYNLHWWSKFSDQSYYDIHVGDYGGKRIYFSSKSTENKTYAYSDGIEISEDGTLTLTEPISTVALSGYDFTSNVPKVLLGKYVKVPTMANVSAQFVHIATDSTFKLTANTDDDDYYGSASNAAEITPLFVSGGELVYIYSSERNAYPDDAEQDGFTYKYLGVPLENAVTTNVKTAFGSYVGTGTYGDTNVNTLTFPFAPKMVVVASVAGVGGFPWINGMTEGLCSSTSLTSASATLAWGDNGLSWYSGSAVKQLNVKDTIYFYFAIG